MIYVTGDLHGGDSSYHVTSAKFKPAKHGDIVLCCGDFAACGITTTTRMKGIDARKTVSWR